MMTQTPFSPRPPLDDVTAFATTIFRRADGIEDVVPRDFTPDWADRPATFRCYEHRRQVLLPSQARLFERYDKLRSKGSSQISTNLLSTIMYLMIAPLRRKLSLSWNAQNPPSGFNQQECHRGSASGGGLYPTQIYLIGGTGVGGIARGVYHYSPGHHALTPLRRGDHRGLVAKALSSTSASEAYLVLTSDFWQNCFKYHNFGYHVCSQDVGAVIATAHLAATALKISHKVHLIFNDATLESLIGIRPDSEGVFAVIAIGDAANTASDKTTLALSVPAPRQRSRVVRIPHALQTIHATTRLQQLPSSLSAVPALAKRFNDQFDISLLDTLPHVLMRRRSAWGSMRGAPFLAAQLKTLLGFMARHVEAGSMFCDFLLEAGGIDLLFQVNSVAGLERGAYRWNVLTGGYDSVPSTPPPHWQSTYSMLNYNIDTTDCILFITGNLPMMIAQYGPAGYRVLNAHIGALAQLAYTGAAALDLDCGVVLGVCAQKVKECIALRPDHEVMLAVYLGGKCREAKLFDFHFMPGAKK